MELRTCSGSVQATGASSDQAPTWSAVVPLVKDDSVQLFQFFFLPHPLLSCLPRATERIGNRSLSHRAAPPFHRPFILRHRTEHGVSSLLSKKKGGRGGEKARAATSSWYLLIIRTFFSLSSSPSSPPPLLLLSTHCNPISCDDSERGLLLPRTQ